MSKLLSINIPTFNRAKFLINLFDSIGNELSEFSEIIEVLIIDNCSLDNTRDVAETLCNKYICVNYVCNAENIGPMANIHKAHRAGSGKYVWVMGDDDYLVKDGFRRALTVLKSQPAAVLLSYSRVRPDGVNINNVSIGSKDNTFINSKEKKIVKLLDPLIGFISANIIERTYIDQVSYEQYEMLDRTGELAHSLIVYRAIASGRAVFYLSGQPLVQTSDNGYLKHEYWVHVCVKYCIELPQGLAAIGLGGHYVEKYFRRRLFNESVRRILSEKYRNKNASIILEDELLKKELGLLWFFLVILFLIPRSVVRSVHDSIKNSRR